MIAPQSQAVATHNGRFVAATFFSPPSQGKGSVLVVCAMGVNQGYYGAFAQWLASQGYLVATFDFFGTGRSLQGSPRDVDVDVLQWAQFDCSAMVEALRARLPDKPLYWIGHSLGAQILPFTPSWPKVSRAVLIASGSGYWRQTTPGLRWRAALLFFGVVPLLVPLAGYFPGRRLRMVGDLPAGVIRQWRRWCLHPQYAVGAEGPWAQARYAAVNTALTSLSFTDDEFMSARNTESLLQSYVHAPKSIQRIAPEQIGVERIGHFGFFREGFRDSLWQRYLLPELTDASAPPAAAAR